MRSIIKGNGDTRNDGLEKEGEREGGWEEEEGGGRQSTTHHFHIGIFYLFPPNWSHGRVGEDDDFLMMEGMPLKVRCSALMMG